ncbi:MAG: Holliday junction branch migration protein RuvA [Pseudobacteriovorax sp.]|nr:Holliday junction branch migration protein RuvA [Pseudobacteriovorax sp.]
MWIERLRGRYDSAHPSGVIIDVSGVGYGLEVPLTTLAGLPPVGSELTLWVYSHVREDSIRLFGFTSQADKAIFEILLSISGVGPKVALAILSTLSVTALKRAVRLNDSHSFKSVPGVGQRMAEKILLELRPKIARMIDAEVSLPLVESPDQAPKNSQEDESEEFELVLDDVRSALANLGYKEKAVAPILQKLVDELPRESDFQSALKLALAYLSEGNRDTKKGRPASKPAKQQELF